MAHLKDLALEAGVSIRTVNRVLKEEGYVGAATSKAVRAAIRKLGYRPHLAARALKTSKSHIVPVLAFTTDEVRMAQLAALEQVLREAGYLVSTAFHLDPASREQGVRIVRELIGQNPAGVALLGHDPYVLKHVLPFVMAPLLQARLPYVILDPRGEIPYDAVNIDRGHGVKEAVRFLAERGARRIAFLGPSDDRTRLDGYEAALAALSRRPMPLDFPGLEPAALREAGRRLAGMKQRPDAVVAHSDHIALPFLAGLHDCGVRVPGEVALVGFDDRPAAALAWPPLTTIAQPSCEIGRAGAGILLRKIAGEKKPREGWSRTFPTRLIVRESA